MRFSREAQIVNLLGLHARPAARLVKLASRFSSELELMREGERVNAKSILGVMTLAAEYGCTLTVSGDGEDAQAAVDALVELISRGFEET